MKPWRSSPKRGKYFKKQWENEYDTDEINLAIFAFQVNRSTLTSIELAIVITSAHHVSMFHCFIFASSLLVLSRHVAFFNEKPSVETSIHRHWETDGTVGCCNTYNICTFSYRIVTGCCQTAKIYARQSSVVYIIVASLFYSISYSIFISCYSLSVVCQSITDWRNLVDMKRSNKKTMIRNNESR